MKRFSFYRHATLSKRMVPTRVSTPVLVDAFLKASCSSALREQERRSSRRRSAERPACLFFTFQVRNSWRCLSALVQLGSVTCSNKPNSALRCIIFIDELDAIGKSRSVGQGGMLSHDERDQTLNQLLAEMDGFDTSSGVILMAATNTPEVLDAALLRAGRFDRQVLVDRPDVEGREAILKVHTKRVKLSPNVDLKIIAARTPGMVGADLANVINEGALLAARRQNNAVEMKDIEEAIDRVLLGLGRNIAS